MFHKHCGVHIGFEIKIIIKGIILCIFPEWYKEKFVQKDSDEPIVLPSDQERMIESMSKEE